MKYLKIYEDIFDDWDEEEIEDEWEELTDERLVKFLKKHDAYDQFISNLKEYPLSHGKSISEFCDKGLSLGGPHLSTYISNAFHWDYTPEGEKYWLRIDDMWINMIYELHENVDNIFDDWDEEEIDEESIVDEFIEFLKKHNAYDKFKEKYTKRLEKSDLMDYIKERGEIAPETLIRGAFYWGEHSYWMDLDARWVKYLSTNENVDDIFDDWDEEEIEEEPTGIDGYEIGDIVTVRKCSIKNHKYNNLKGTIIAFGPSGNMCIEFYKLKSGHNGNQVVDIDGKIIDFGKRGHCWWFFGGTNIIKEN